MNRRLLWWIPGILILVLVAGISIFLATFDLDRYRGRIEEAFSSALDRPVDLGEASFSIRHGPAVSFSDVELDLGGPMATRLRIPYLLLTLELRPLLGGRLVFSAVELIEPEILMELSSPAETPPAAEPEPAQEASAPALDDGLLETTLIRSLSIHDGRLRILSPGKDDAFAGMELFDLELQVDDLGLLRKSSGQLRASLRQSGKAARIRLQLQAGEPVSEASIWKSRPFQAELSVEGLYPASLQGLLPAAGEQVGGGRLSLAGTLRGSWAEGVEIAAEISGERYRLPIGEPTLALNKATVQGRWSPEEGYLKLEDLRLRTDQGSLAGRMLLEHRDKTPWLEGNLSTSPLSLAWLGSVLPQPLAGTLRSGSLQVDSLEFTGPVADWRGPPSGWPLQAAQGEVTGAELAFPGGVLLRALRADWVWGPEGIHLTQGKAGLLEAAIRFSATLREPFREEESFELEVSGTWPVATLLKRLPKRPENLRASGEVPLSILVEGTRMRQEVDLQADLVAVALESGTWLQKPAGRPAELFAALAIDPERVELSHGRLEVAPLELRVRGYRARTPEAPYRLELDLEQAELTTIRELVPALDRYDPRGELSLRYHWQGAEGIVRDRGGRIALHQAGFHIIRTLPDLQQLNGEILLGETAASFDGVSGRLGNSPLTGSGTIHFQGPSLDLEVSSPALRAQDLFFPSTRQVFADVHGRLAIDRQQVRLDSVRLTLPRGTRAEVRGSVSRFRAPLVELEVDAAEAVIDEIVSLWKDPDPEKSREERAEEPKTKRRVEVRVATRVEKGHLGFSGPIGNLSFRRAEGTVSYQDRLLTVHPLSFDSGDGYFLGRVTLEGKEQGPGLLRVSGHLENFDAAAFYHDLLQRRGLITGTLRGDFYLQGMVGDRFLDTSLGGLDVEVKDGVLRKFNFLSKVFSLLNVSQILTLKLPDMSSEGMPFTRLTASFDLEQGTLATEDLFVKSNAMNLSLVGSYRLQESQMDFVLGVKPLRTVDRIITKIPIAGWLLTGDEKALVTVHFEIKGPPEDPRVAPLPITSVSEKVLGIFKRVFGLPEKMIRELGGETGESAGE